MPVLEAAARQPEVIEQIIQWLSGNRNCQIIHARKIGQAEPSRFVHLPENDFTILRDCQDFRVWPGIMGNKESHYVTTQRTCHTE